MDAVSELRHAFTTVAVPADAASMAAYMKYVAPFLGVKTDVRRRMVRQWCDQVPLTSADDVIILAHHLLAEPEREFHYAAADIVAYRIKFLDAVFVERYAESFLLRHPWWDTVDLWGSDVINPLCVRHDCTATMWQWNSSGNRWLVRASIQHQRGRKRDYDVELILAMCMPHIADSEFFVAKAIGWALRDMAKYQPVCVRQFVDAHPQLSAVARREALRGLERLTK